MFEEYKFQRQLRALLKRRERTVASYDANLAKARSEKQKSDKIYEIQERRDFEVTLVNDEIGVLSSKFWLDRAHIYQVAVPDNWEMSAQLGQSFLSRAATAQIRTDIRNEKKAKWDWWQARVTLVLSIFGSVIGLLAYFKK
jgi:hypothetical protein